MRRNLLIGTLLAAVLSAWPSGARAAVKVGDLIPNFNLLDLSGTGHSPLNYRGKVLVIWMVGYN